jgi:hypothetical protein
VSRLPDFLGIGAQKSGTTWLHHNLSQHPGVWLPPVKELHFFDHPHRTPSALLLPLPGWQARRARKEIPRLWHARRDPAVLRWHLRFLLGVRRPAWYASLFEPAPGQICGEITPGYDILDDTAVARIRALMPGLRVIYLLRDPVERLWSALAMHAEKFRWGRLAGLPRERLMRYLDWELPRRHCDYLANLATWERHFPPGRVHVDFFDRLAAEPAALYRDLCGFLGVDASPGQIPADVATPRYPRRYPPPPPEIAALLRRRLRPQVEGLHRRFHNPFTARWLESIDIRSR